ncbi:MAG: YceI family protein [Bacteroidota bacterium]|nr:YceI family protein [Bacteroidota bacterium]
MKRISLIGLLAISTILLSFKTLQPVSWSLDKNHGKLGFTITHLMVSEIEGSFMKFDAKITAPKADFSDAVVEMTAESTSINTDNEKRDEHLRSADFFDVAKYPLVTFKSTSFKKTGATTYIVKGDLTMHGITKSIALDVRCIVGADPVSKQPIAGFKISGKVKRSDFGIGPSFTAAMLGDDVTITANAEFRKQ